MRASAGFSRRGVGAVLSAVTLLVLAGCNPTGQYPVKGQLVYEDDGQPIKELEGETITFDSPELGKNARGTIAADGTFKLGTLTENDGAVPGKYKVTLSQPWPQPERTVRGKPVVDKMYEDPQKTPLEITVEAKSNDFTFKLKRLKK